MRINSINSPVNIQGNKNIENPNNKKATKTATAALLTTGLLSTAAATGAILAKKHPNNQYSAVLKKVFQKLKSKISLLKEKFSEKFSEKFAKKFPKVIEKKPCKALKIERDSNIIRESVETITNPITNNSETIEIVENRLLGKDITRTFSKPINGVKKVHIQRNTEGKLTRINSFRDDGSLIKAVEYANSYSPKINVSTDEGITEITFEYFKNHKGLKQVNILRPDGEQKITKGPHYLLNRLRNLIN